MYDIIFDFSASPIGGGLLRLKEYIRFFNDYNNDVLFLVHPKVSEELLKNTSCKIVAYPRNPLKRVFFDRLFLKEYTRQAYCFFSYGIPIYNRIAEKNWMHLSNALPFGYKKCTLSLKSRLKNYLLFLKFRQINKNIDFISGESQFTIDLFSGLIESSAEKILLHNGFNIDTIKCSRNLKRNNIALTVGGESYKRLDLVYKCFLSLKEQKQTSKLLIRADLRKIPSWIRDKKDVEIIGNLSYSELMDLYQQSTYYISMSEIENSSNAVLEALYCGCIVYLSKIPSHLEMFSDEINNHFQEYIIATKEDLKKDNSFTWDEIIKKMCSIADVKLR